MNIEMEEIDGKLVGNFLGTPFIKQGFITESPKGLYFNGMFHFRDTMGLPLTIQFDHLQKLADEQGKPVNPCIRDFIHRAEMAGWNKSSAIAQISEMFTETFGPNGKQVCDDALLNGYWIQPSKL